MSVSSPAYRVSTHLREKEQKVQQLRVELVCILHFRVSHSFSPSVPQHFLGQLDGAVGKGAHSTNL